MEWLRECPSLQVYISRTPNGFIRTDFHCPQRRTCGCNVAFCTKEYTQKVDLYASGTHTADSHTRSTARLSQTQKNAALNAVRASPLATGYSVHRNLGNMGPEMEVGNDKRSRASLTRLVLKERRAIMHRETGGKKMTDSVGAMVEIGNMLLLSNVIEQHNSETNPFHLDAHTVISGGYKVEGTKLFLNTTTPHLVNNMTRGLECGWPTQLHVDGAFNLCTKDFGVIGIGMNSMGARLNTVSLSLASTESADMIDEAYESSVTALHLLYAPPPIGPKLCDSPACSFCRMLKNDNTGIWKQYLASDTGKAKKFEVRKPSSDNTNIFFGWAKRKFGGHSKVFQCGAHATGHFNFSIFCYTILTSIYAQLFPSSKASSSSILVQTKTGYIFIN